MVHKYKNQYNSLEYSRLHHVGHQEYSAVGNIESEVVTQWTTEGETRTSKVKLQLHSITSTTALVLSQAWWEEWVGGIHN